MQPPRTDFKLLKGSPDIVGRCRQMRDVFTTVRKIAMSPSATVLVLGESGTGKELIARAIHESGPFADQPFVEINCSALPETLIETELFGYEAGAFTDAKRTKKGLLELADGGTFFMDEIGDLNSRLQVKLVKALEDKCFRRIGGTENIQVTMRIIAATNKNLSELIQTGKFREDLFYRLNVVTIHAPPLRGRGKDVILLANHFLNLFNAQHDRNVKSFCKEAKELLLEYDWPGNVRELKNAIERAVLLGSANQIKAADLELGSGHIPQRGQMQVRQVDDNEIEFPFGISLADLERTAIEKALRKSKGNLSEAARLLQVSRETLRYRVKKHDITA